MPPAISPTEAALFWDCTTIQLGGGKTTKFWHNWWLSGRAPKELALDLFKLAWMKNVLVADAISNGKWMCGLRRISSTQEVCQFVDLWHSLNQVQLTGQPDYIVWRFLANGSTQRAQPI
jgi:hypothetical protein